MNKLSQLLLFKLTNAIEKAASVAMLSKLNPSKILASELKKANIPNKLNKIATQAFNRRFSVLLLSSRNDETKAESFPIADLKTVLTLRGILSLNKKASALAGAFIFSFQNKANIKKTASEVQPKVKINSTPEPTIPEFLRKMLSAIDKDTIYIQKIFNLICDDQTALQQLKKHAYAELKKDINICNQLTTQYGTVFTKLFDLLPKLYIQKKAQYAVLKKCAAVLLTEKAILLADSIMHKKAAYNLVVDCLGSCIKVFEYLLPKLILALFKGLNKTAGGYTIGKAILADTLTDTLNGASNMVGDTAKAYDNLMSKFYSMSHTGLGKNPSFVLNSKLLSADKAQDAKIALALIASDPSTKNFPFREILKYVLDAVGAHDLYLKPSALSLLRAKVKDNLISGGLNSAMLAAEITSLKDAALTLMNKGVTSAVSVVLRMPEVKSKISAKELATLGLFDDVHMPRFADKELRTTKLILKTIKLLDDLQKKLRDKLLKELADTLKELKSRGLKVKSLMLRQKLLLLAKQDVDASGKNEYLKWLRQKGKDKSDAAYLQYITSTHRKDNNHKITKDFVVDKYMPTASDWVLTLFAAIGQDPASLRDAIEQALAYAAAHKKGK